MNNNTLTEEEKAEGWRPHDGTSCPVFDGPVIQVRCRGYKPDDIGWSKWAAGLGWKHTGGYFDITAYRVFAPVKPSVSPSVGELVEAAQDVFDNLSEGDFISSTRLDRLGRALSQYKDEAK